MVDIVILKIGCQKLRRERRILARSMFSITSIRNESQVEELSPNTSVGPTTRSKTKVKRSDGTTIPSTSSGHTERGSPTAQDSQGRCLFTRPSDGKLVYLQCCVTGCGRTKFPNARALRNHVSSPVGLHKIMGLIISNTQAIEVCGQVAPSQEEASITAGDQPLETGSFANTTRAVVLPSSPTGSDEYHRHSKAGSRSISDAEARSCVTLSKTLERFKAQDLGRTYRTRFSHHDSQKEARARAEEAAEGFHGFMSSDSEDSDESEDGPLQNRRIPADRIDQHKATKRVTNPSTFLQADATSSRERAKIAGGDSALVVLAVGEQSIKRERSTSPSLFLEEPERRPSPKTLAAAPGADHVPKFETELMPNLRGESIATRKRANSAPPIASPAVIKRLRLTDESLEHLVRSCSGVAMGRGH